MLHDDIQTFADTLCKRKYLRKIISASLPVLIGFLIGTVILNLLFYATSFVLLILIWDISCLLVALSIIGIFVYFQYFKKTTISDAVREIEHKSMISHPLVSIAIELAHEKPTIFTERINAESVKQIHLLKKIKIPFIHHNRTLYALLIALGLSGLAALLPENIYKYYKVPFLTGKYSDALILPGTINTAKNQVIVLQCIPSHFSIPVCKLTITSLQNGIRKKYLLRPDSAKSFVYSVDSNTTSFIYEFNYGNHQFAPETVNVFRAPVLQSIKIRIQPPPYIGGSNKDLPDGVGDFSAYKGSTIFLHIESSPLNNAEMIFNTETLQMNVVGHQASAKFVLDSMGSYTFSLVDTFLQKSDSLPVFTFNSVTDEFPDVFILRPAMNKDLSKSMAETLWVEASDDIGIKSVSFKWRKNGEDATVNTMNIYSGPAKRLIQNQIPLNLKKYSLYPGDTLYYWISVRDNYPYSGNHISTTDTFWFRVPGFDEMRRKSAEQDRYVESKLMGVQNKQEELNKMVDDILSSQSENRETSWEQRQMANDLRENLKAQADSLDNAVQELEKNIEQMKQQGTMGEDLAKKMDEIKKAIDELVKQYGDSLFANMSEKKDLDWQDLKEAVDKVKEMLPELDDQLENTLQFLEMFKKDKELAELAMKAEELAKEQAEIANTNDSEKNKNEQENILDRLEDLQKQIDTTVEKSNALSKQMKSLDSVNQKMKSSLSQKMMPGKEMMNSMSASMLNLSEELREMMSSRQMERMEAMRNMLLETGHDALTVAEWQKELINSRDEDDEDRKESARMQQVINDALSKMEKRTDSLGMLPPPMIQSIRDKFNTSIKAAQDAITSFDQYDHKSSMIQSAHSINSLANELLTIASSGNDGQQGGSGSMMSGLRKLSGKQAAINAATSELLQSLMNGSKSGKQGTQPGKQGEGQSGGSGDAQRMAAQEAQKRIADELKRLSDQYGNEGGDGLVKRVEELEKEARRIAEMLTRPGMDLPERQNQFLSRMLQSTLSLHKQDEGKDDRKSKSAQDIFSQREILPLNNRINGADLFHIIRRRALTGSFPESYRSSINMYFDSLSSIYLKSKQKKSAQ
jgi:hypothetical protein